MDDSTSAVQIMIQKVEAIQKGLAISKDFLQALAMQSAEKKKGLEYAEPEYPPGLF